MSISSVINSQTIIRFTKENRPLIKEYLMKKVKVVNRVNRHNKYNPEKPNLNTLLHSVNYAQQNMDDCHKLFIKLSDTISEEMGYVGESVTTRAICQLEKFFLSSYFKISESKCPAPILIKTPSFTLIPTERCAALKNGDRFFIYTCEESYLTEVWVNPEKSLAHVYYYTKSFFLDTKSKRKLPKELKSIKDKVMWGKKVSTHVMNQLQSELEKHYPKVLVQKND